jgi:hypothetical protein
MYRLGVCQDRGMIYRQAAGLAEAWQQAGERALRSDEWRPTGLERAVAGQLCRTGRIASEHPPPFDKRRLAYRLTALAGIAPTYRLALLGLNAEPTALHTSPGEGPATLALLLRGLLPLAETAEQWDHSYNALYTPAAAGTRDRLRRLGEDPAAADRHDVEDVHHEGDDLLADLADTERFFVGFGCVGELFVAIAAGDL